MDQNAQSTNKSGYVKVEVGKKVSQNGNNQSSAEILKEYFDKSMEGIKNEINELRKEIAEKNQPNSSNILIQDDIPLIINSKLTTKDVYETLWRCRDFEISHLWQRSIFLTAFLILCYTGYGALIALMVAKWNDSNIIYCLNNIALCISSIGFIFSGLWILMGKGSKAWYEKYENAITAFCDINKYCIDEDTKNIAGFKYDKIPDYKAPSTSKCILSTSGGPYSPSRINIVIGIISLAIWIIIFGVHTYFQIYKFEWHEAVDSLWGILGIAVIITSLFILRLVRSR